MTERAEGPTKEAQERGKMLIGALVIMHGMGIHADRLTEAEEEAAFALDAFAREAAELQRERVLVFLRNEQTAWRITADSDAWRYNPNVAAELNQQAQAVWRIAVALADALEKANKP